MRLAVPALALLSLLALLRAHGATAPSVAGSDHLGLERASTGAQTLAAEAAVAAAEAAVAAAEAAAAVAEERRLDPDASSTAEVAREQGGATPEASHSGSVHAAPDSSTRRATDGGGGTRSHSHGEVRPKEEEEWKVQLKPSVVARAPSIGGVDRRESALAKRLRLQQFHDLVMDNLGPLAAIGWAFSFFLIFAYCAQRFLSRSVLVTLLYTMLYLIASPVAIMANKILMKDKGFGYPVMVSAMGQVATALCAAVVVFITGESLETGRKIGATTLLVLGCVSALALVLGQYPYFYLTVAFIQMLKAFSPAYMICFLFCLGVERPSNRVIRCVLGLSVCTCIASAGEVNFSLIGVLFMTMASCSDALRLVIAQKLLKNQKMGSFEALVYTAPACLFFMAPVALFKEIPAARKAGSFALVSEVPLLFFASAFSGFVVNVASFLLVKRTSSVSLKLITMARNGGLVLASALFFGETITALEGIGYAGLLLFFALYTVAKNQEAAAPKEHVSSAVPTDTEAVPLNDPSGCDSMTDTSSELGRDSMEKA